MSEKMTVAKFLTHPIYGCGSSSDVIRFSQTDKVGFDKLKEYAREEMKNRGIEVEEIVKA